MIQPINVAVELTIEPCTVIEFEDNTNLQFGENRLKSK